MIRGINNGVKFCLVRQIRQHSVNKSQGQRNSDFYKFGFGFLSLTVGAIFGANHIEKRIEGVDKRIESVERRIDNSESHIKQHLEDKIALISKDMEIMKKDILSEFALLKKT